MAQTIDEYIRVLPEDVQEILEQVRATITAAVPNPGEKISYQMPTITMDGVSLVYFAGWKKHVGMYPVPVGDADFETAVRPYRAAKDSVNFPYRKPIPYQVISRIVTLMVQRRQAETGQ